MNRTDLHRHLDGEIPEEALTPEAREELAEWREILDLTASLRTTTAPPWLETRVMHAVSTAPRPRHPARAVWQWFLEPMTVRLRPAFLAAALILLGLGLTAWPVVVPTAADRQATADALAAGSSPGAYVQFVFVGNGVHSVAVAGDFNHWDPATNPLRDLQGNGVWTGMVALAPGIHRYMFVVDGNEWVTDPRAGQSIEDGFGMRNALITVAPSVQQPLLVE